MPFLKIDIREFMRLTFQARPDQIMSLKISEGKTAASISIDLNKIDEDFKKTYEVSSNSQSHDPPKSIDYSSGLDMNSSDQSENFAI